MLLSNQTSASPNSIVSFSPVFAFIHLLFDTAAITAAWWITLEIRVVLNPYFRTSISRDTLHNIAFRPALLLLLWFLTALWLNTYRDRGHHSLAITLFRLTESTVALTSLVIVVTFFSRQVGIDLSRFFAVLFTPVCFVLLICSLASTIWFANRVEQRWRPPQRIALLGAGEQVNILAQRIHHMSPRTVTCHGLIVPESVAVSAGGFCPNISIPVLGSTRELATVINREYLDKIIIAPGSLTEPELKYCGDLIKKMGVIASHPIFRADSGFTAKHRISYGMHLIDFAPATVSCWRDLIKRTLDSTVSISAIAILLPVFVVLACLIRTTSEGPVFYRSQRVGKGGRYFTFWKFRSMYVNGPTRTALLGRNETSGHIFKIRDDPRVTPVGRVMRRLSLDELPQLFNVLAGEMSLVGPRPLPVEDLNPDGMSGDYTEWAEKRSLVRPGITGLWQIRGRSSLSFAEMVELDIDYVRNWSLLLDLRILFQTPSAVVSGKGAY